MTTNRPNGIPAPRTQPFTRAESDVVLEPNVTTEEPGTPHRTHAIKARELGHHDPELHISKTVIVEKDGETFEGTLRAHELTVFELNFDEARRISIVAVAILVNDRPFVLSGEDSISILS